MPRIPRGQQGGYAHHVINIIAAEFRTRSELNQPYVWQPPMISEVDLPARIVNGMMIPAHREFVIVRPGYWVRTESMFHPVP